jgi:L-asparagine transporter-like permease
VTIVGMVALLVGMLFDADARSQLLLSLLVAAVVVAVGVVRGRRSAPRPVTVPETT